MSLCIVLVKPEISQNVGFVARAMKCFNVDDLRIVGKRRYPPISYAYKTGCSATDILDGASYYKTLPEALKSVSLSLGFTKRPRELTQRVDRLRETVPALDLGQPTALVFGRESQGLSQEDCMATDKLIKIDLPNPELSLNLSHAVTLALFEIFAHGLITDNPLVMGTTKAKETKPKKTAPAPDDTSLYARKEDTFRFITRILKEKKVFLPNKMDAHLKYLRQLWQRANPSEKEAEFLMGVISKGMKGKVVSGEL
jgi:tRNA/rRNA methyltransferase